MKRNLKITNKHRIKSIIIEFIYNDLIEMKNLNLENASHLRSNLVYDIKNLSISFSKLEIEIDKMFNHELVFTTHNLRKNNECLIPFQMFDFISNKNWKEKKAELLRLVKVELLSQHNQAKKKEFEDTLLNKKITIFFSNGKHKTFFAKTNIPDGLIDDSEINLIEINTI